MTTPSSVTLQPDELNDAANQLPDAQQSTADAQDAMTTMDKLPEAGATSDAAGQASLADAIATRGGGDAGGGGNSGGDAGGEAGGATAGGAAGKDAGGGGDC